MRVNLPNGKTVEVNTSEWFAMNDAEVEEFYQSCMADDLGIAIENPFSSKKNEKLDIDIEEEPEVDED